MRLLIVFLAAVLLALSLPACGATQHPREGYLFWDQVPPATCHQSVHRDYDATEWDSTEQPEVSRPSTMWAKLSGAQFAPDGSVSSPGLVGIGVYFADPPPGAAKIRRVSSGDQIVIDHELAQPKQANGEPFIVAGWHGKDGTIYIVHDRVKPGRLHALLAHEMGHGIDLHWPWCPEFIEAELEGGEPCIHSPDPYAIMGPTWDNNAEEMTPSDLAFCRGSCFCL